MTQEEFNAMLAVGISQGLPGSYYTSRYKNGEEIDRRLGNAAVPAVGENILINADFRNPVNRNGQTVYTSRGFCIDNWFAESPVTIESDCISISASIGGGIIQALERVPNGPLTFSIIVKEGKGVLFAENNQAVYFSGAGLYFITYQNGINPITDKIYIRAQDYSTLKLVAAKLESGSTQTLAKQNSDGKWEPIAPPNYPLQYALCSQYSPSTGEWVGSQHSNPNLLDNWYFLDPINQRGQTEYKVSGYTIDRWRNENPSANTVISITPNGLSFSGSWNSAGHFFSNILDISPDFFYGKKLTGSLLVDGQLLSGSITVRQQYGEWDADTFAGNDDVFFQFQMTPIGKFRFIIIYKQTAVENAVTLQAAKLELGSVQTLAHQDPDGKWILNDAPPNKALELAKCQRYYIPEKAEWTVGGNVPGSGLILTIPSVLRTTPALAGMGNKVYSGSNWIEKQAIGVFQYPTYTQIMYGHDAAIITGPILFERQPALDADL